MKSNNIQIHLDFDHLKVLKQGTDKKIAALKNSFENCKRLYDTYSDIAHTYHEISKGDYISKLVAEEQKNNERDDQQKRRKDQFNLNFGRIPYIKKP